MQESYKQNYILVQNLRIIICVRTKRIKTLNFVYTLQKQCSYKGIYYIFSR